MTRQGNGEKSEVSKMREAAVIDFTQSESKT
jgi:hypothetical protein